jgi:2-oxoglutarate dehydrogenase E1 component
VGMNAKKGNALNDLSFAGRANVAYLDELFRQFQENPEAVDPDWARFFQGVEFGRQLPPLPAKGAPSVAGAAASSNLDKELKVESLINSYRDIGHYQAHLNPLDDSGPKIADLDIASFGLGPADLQTRFQCSARLGLSNATLQEVIQFLEQSYCGKITVEYAGLRAEMRDWVRNEFEGPARVFSKEEKLQIFRDLTNTDALERFFHTRFVGMKRFSIEGSDSLIPMLETFAFHGVKEGLEEIVVAMAHRGRINVLANFMGKALELVFSEFDGRYNPDTSFADGDVKYHMGFSADKKTENGSVHVSLAFNPSHLEAVTPVATGMVRAKQIQREDERGTKVVPILIHGDAAVIGQGVVGETLQLSNLTGYRVGGSIHIVLNNQVGFTTDPSAARSTHYCTDVVKQLGAPVIHVNGDDVESCIRAMNIALRFRQRFCRDIVIDLVSYRRHGHNEGDEPAFTQPVMYAKIKNHPTPREVYGAQLTAEGVLANGGVKEAFDARIQVLQERLESSRSAGTKPFVSTLQGKWLGLRRAKPEDFDATTETSVSQEQIEAVAESLTSYPKDFTPHPKLLKLLDSRAKMVARDGKIDWGMGEMLAYGTLLQEGVPVRLSGQDVSRGTFTHRHAVYTDAETGKAFSPLSTFRRGTKGVFHIHNSPLSEYAVLGFEYGFSLSEPHALTIWEAQFGDFANGAQIIIDQFLSSAESKWQRMSGLVMLLPHGYEGQGPEHSNARPERFLQLAGQMNLQVCNFTTPAQLFHALRRQVKRDFRKPLVVMSPKALLRHPKVVSSPEEFTNGSFREVLPDPDLENPRKVKRLILTSGKLYYELAEERMKQATRDEIAILRIEQYYPFPANQLAKAVKAFGKLEQVIWAQEEPKNMGAYSFLAPRLQEVFAKLGPISFRYVGRSERASPAIGILQLHIQEQEEIIKSCFA